MNFLNTFKGKKVLITGHTGFKGGWLAFWLLNSGAEVVGIALPPAHEYGIFRLTGIENHIRNYYGDIRNLDFLMKVFTTEKPEIVFHLAAQSLVLESYRNPLDTFTVNILGTANILQVIGKSGCTRAAIIVTSDKCYENRETIWGYRESDPMGGADPYSASKGAVEIIINSWKKSFFNLKSSPLIASVRAGNVIGGGDWNENRLIPDVIKAIENDQPIPIRNPEAIRPWQYVLEPLSGYLLLGEKLLHGDTSFAEPWNFGPDMSEIITVREVVEMVLKKIGKGTWIDLSDQHKPHEAHWLHLDITKAICKLGWKPVLKFEEAINMTIDWYLCYNKTDIEKFSLEQLRYFESKWNSRSVH